MTALINVLNICKNNPGSGFNTVFNSQRVTRPPGKIAVSSVGATKQCSHVSEQSPALFSLRAPANLCQIHQPLANHFFVRMVLLQQKRSKLPGTILSLPKCQDSS